MLDFASVFLHRLSRREPTIPMKTTTSLKFFQPAVAAALAIVIAWGLSLRPAQAVPYVVTLQQVGPDVVATGTGAFNLIGLSFVTNSGALASVNPKSGVIQTGPTTSSSVSVYTGASGPTSFGSGGATFANLGTGDPVGILGGGGASGHGALVVPFGYVSGTALSDTSTYDGATFSSLGVTPGTYVWTWGRGVNQNFTLIAAVPDAGSTFGLLFLSLIALFGVNRLRARQLA